MAAAADASSDRTPARVVAGPPDELVCSNAYLLKRLGAKIKERTLGAFEAAGESPYHYAVLAVLGEKARETQATIADALGYDRSWLVRLLDELEQAGLVARKRDPVDRRRHLVSLNPAGREKLAELRAISSRVEDEFLDCLGPAQRRQLHALLRQVAAHHDPRYPAKPTPRSSQVSAASRAGSRRA